MTHLKILAHSSFAIVFALVASAIGFLLICPNAADAHWHRHCPDIPGSVSQFSRMLVQRACFTATGLQDGRVLVTGGIVDAVGDATASAELYDPATGLFTYAGSMKYARRCHSATALPNGDVVLIGGSPDGTPAEVYHTATGAFTIAGIPTPETSHHTATALANGPVLITGGTVPSAEGGPEKTAQLFDPTTGQFSATGVMSDGRTGHTATLLADGKVLIAGGNDFFAGSGGTVSTAEVYDPGTGTFAATGSMTVARERHTATALLDGTVLVTGGLYNVARQPFDYQSSAEIYDPASGNFTEVGEMTDARYAHTATLLSDGNVLIAGGTNSFPPTGAVDYVEIYDPVSQLFTTGSTMTNGRYNLQALLLKSSLTLIMGGYDASNTPVYTTDIFNP
jgi:Galactose oxidase, central domain/Kelch motif